MSRGGAGGAADGNPLILQSRPSNDEAPQKFPPFQVPHPTPLSQADRELTERGRFLSETLKYSGYYVVPHASSTRLLQKHGLVSTAFTPDPGATSSTGAVGGDQDMLQQQIYTPQLERYSDRYRKILGKKGFYDEIPTPNPHLFPPELLSSKHQLHSSSTFTSKVQFLSSKSLDRQLAVNEVGGERMSDARSHGAGGVDADRKDDEEGGARGGDEDEDDNMQEEQPESDQEEEGGDYVNDYGDDDEDGGDAFGDDDEGETM